MKANLRGPKTLFMKQVIEDTEIKTYKGLKLI